MREIVLDTETTGLNPKGGDRLVEIGCVEMVNRFATGKVWHQYFNPERPMPEEAFKVHGLSDEFLAGKPLFGELADDFLEFIDGARLIIHNAPFDMGFLNHELAMLGKPPIPMTNVVDSLQIARQKHPGAANNLDALCRRYGVDNSARDKHGALLDSEILAEVYLHLIGGHQAGLDLDGSAGGTLIRGGGGRGRGLSLALRNNGQDRAEAAAKRSRPLPSRLSDDEIRAHEEFVAGLGEKPLWNLYKP